jgi:hypothetical protein
MIDSKAVFPTAFFIWRNAMKKLIILSLSIFISVNSFSQIEKISGRVIDSETKLPLQLANIYIKGTNVGTTSDKKGDFLLSGRISNSDTLVISFLG